MSRANASVYHIIVVLGILATVTPVTAATKVYLLGGQSNMAGVGGRQTDQPCPEPYNQVQTTVKFWNYGILQQVSVDGYGGKSLACPGTGDGWVDLQPGYGANYTTEFGPEVSFGYRLRELYPDDDIYLVKLGLSNADLAVDWNTDGTGPVYGVFKARVNAAIQALDDDGLDPQITGMIWMQGESDALNASYAANYLSNLTNFITTLRSTFDAPDMPFVIGRILTYYDTTPDGGNALVRTAQETIQNQLGMTHISWINTDDLELAYEGHYGTQGQIDLGVGFANALAPTPEPSTFVLSMVSLIMVLAYFTIRRGSGKI